MALGRRDLDEDFILGVRCACLICGAGGESIEMKMKAKEGKGWFD